MKKAVLFAVVCISLGMLCAKPSYGQARPQVVAVGSSAQFSIMGIAAVSGDPITSDGTTCGTHVWSFKGNVPGSSPAVPMAAGIDSRSTQIPAEPGTIWIVWDNDTSPTLVCAYLSVDSIVGQRLMLEQTSDTTYTKSNGTISLNSAATSTGNVSGQSNQISFVTDTATTGLPSAVYTIVNGAHFNVAFTDIRPEDGLFATNRALCNAISGDTIKICLGYGPSGSPVTYTAIKSAYSSAIANVVPYSIPPGGVPGSSPTGTSFNFNGVSYTMGADPITGLAIPAIDTIPVGEDPVLVIVNMTGTATGSFKVNNPTNVNSHVLSQIYSGFLGQVADVTGAINSTGSGVASFAPLLVMEREPLSGTFNTFEWQTVRNRGNYYGNSQELANPYPVAGNSNCFTPPGTATFVTPSATCANPLFQPTGFDGSSFRTRVVGTGEMVNAINSANVPDGIGYAFWSLGTFGGKLNVKYLMVDGVDPLYGGSLAQYASAGLFPGTSSGSPNSNGGYCSGTFNATPSTFACTSYTLPNLYNVKNGNYPIWSTLRAIVYTSVQNYQQTTLTGVISPALLIQAAQDQAAISIPDFVPWQVCANSGCSSETQNVTSFRVHYGQTGVFPNNGVLKPYYTANSITPIPEGGGDMEGATYNLSANLDRVNYFGPSADQVNIIQ